jgi:taurine dioxygenase
VVEIRPTGKVLGAAVLGADLSKPLNAKDFGVILGALGRHGVICIPGQKLAAASASWRSTSPGRSRTRCIRKS